MIGSNGKRPIGRGQAEVEAQIASDPDDWLTEADAVLIRGLPERAQKERVNIRLERDVLNFFPRAGARLPDANQCRVANIHDAGEKRSPRRQGGRTCGGKTGAGGAAVRRAGRTRKVPRLRSDKAAEAFLARDLSDLDFAQFQPVRFEFQPKTEWVNMRLSKLLLAAVKKTAARRGISYQRFIRQTLRQAVAGRK